ncbi:MAG: uracil-DNA glycosylase family protein [Pseudomonadales bacterium]
MRPLEGCRACPRLARHLDGLRRIHPDYHCRPVPAWGRPTARLLVVGLAPGLHGANRTGRPFSGDASGVFLFAALARAGFVTSAEPMQARLRDLRITNAVRCLPPGNRPAMDEVRRCSGFLAAELAELWRPGMRRPRCVLALGHLAHAGLSMALGRRLPPFQHGQALPLEPGLLLLDSYHPSRQNTNTGRLTAAMLDAVMERAKGHLYSGRP